MDSITAVHCADLHLGAPISYLSDRAASRQAEQLITFEKIINLCRDNSADVLLIAGDLFDTPDVDKAVADRVFSLIGSIPDTAVIVAAGNHDPLTADSPYLTCSLPENLVVFGENVGTVTIKDKNTNIYGYSFTSGEMTRHVHLPTGDEGKINIFVMHADLGADISSKYNPVSEAQIADSRMDYIALGHIHKRTTVLKSGNTFYAYPGCPEPIGFDETGEKGVYVGKIMKGANSMQFVPISSRRCEEVEVNVTGKTSSAEIAELAESILIDKFGADYGRNLYKIVLTGETEAPFVPDLSYISSVLGLKVYYLKLRNKTSFAHNYEVLAKEFTLKGIFTRKMLEKINAAANSDERAALENALRLGLTAFEAEVKPDEA